MRFLAVSLHNLADWACPTLRLVGVIRGSSVLLIFHNGMADSVARLANEFLHHGFVGDTEHARSFAAICVENDLFKLEDFVGLSGASDIVSFDRDLTAEESQFVDKAIVMPPVKRPKACPDRATQVEVAISSAKASAIARVDSRLQRP